MNNETVTRGIFYCRDSTEINGGGSLQTLSLVDSEVLRSRQQKHTAIRYVQQQKMKKPTLLLDFKTEIKTKYLNK